MHDARNYVIETLNFLLTGLHTVFCTSCTAGLSASRAPLHL